VQAIEAEGIPIHHIDFGGGLGIDYNGDTPPPPTLWHQLLAKLDARGFGQREFLIEPGRSLSATRASASPKSCTSSLARKRTSASLMQR
jgi:diaminopimelate decarboxylase